MTPHLQTLPNGLRVLAVPLHDTQAVTVFVFAKVGSRNESRQMNGAAHFIEHLMFKGTERRPTALEVAKVLDGVGANFNAFTEKEWTGYYVKCHADHFGLALDVVSDILQHSKFDAAEMDRERGVIVEEIKMFEENPQMAIGDLLDRAIFGTHHPLGWDIAGPPEVIKRVTRDELIRFRNRYYHAGNMMVVVAGKLPAVPQEVVAKYFKSVKQRPTTPKFLPYRVAKQAPVLIQHRDIQQAQIGLGMRGWRYNDPRLPATNVMSVILGASFSSRLNIEVREKRGLAYAVGTSASSYIDSGSFSVQAGLEQKRLPEALKVICRELKKMKTTRVTAEELERAKEYIRGKTMLSLEDSDSLAFWYGRQGMFGKKIDSPDQAIQKIMKVRAVDIQKVAAQLFRASAMRLAIIGPYRDAEQFRTIIRQGL